LSSFIWYRAPALAASLEWIMRDSPAVRGCPWEVCRSGRLRLVARTRDPVRGSASAEDGPPHASPVDAHARHLHSDLAKRPARKDSDHDFRELNAAAVSLLPPPDVPGRSPRRSEPIRRLDRS